MFCSNCGSKLADGAKFCSECGARVSRPEPEFRTFADIDFSEPDTAKKTAGAAPVNDERPVRDKVSFDWSNVVDEPHRKEIADIKSPWGTTGNIDEKDLFAEMSSPGGKSRTMSFIDVLKAEKEEREKAAAEKAIEYTEVLHFDHDLMGFDEMQGVKLAPLYDDVDEPVKTPFDEPEFKTPEPEFVDEPRFEEPEKPIDDGGHAEPEESELKLSRETIAQFDEFVKSFEREAGISEEPVFEEPKFEEPEIEEPEFEEPAFEEPSVSMPKFELPDFLKKIADFAKAEEPEIEIPKEPEAEDEGFLTDEPPVIELEDEPEEEPFFEEPAFEEPVAEEPVFEEPKYEDAPAPEEEEPVEVSMEDLYLELKESDTAGKFGTRYDLNKYDYEDDDDDEEEEDEPIDEEELFKEMAEAGSERPSMTIAPPADKESEIEALRKRLAELTGIDLYATEDLAKASDLDSLEPEPEEEPAFEEPAEEPAFEEPVKEPEDELFAEPADDIFEEPEEEKEDEGDFFFTPEVTPEVDELFAELTPANETVKFEPEVTPDIDELFAALMPASKAEEPEAEAPAEPAPAAEPEAPAEPSIEDIYLNYEPEERKPEMPKAPVIRLDGAEIGTEPPAPEVNVEIPEEMVTEEVPDLFVEVEEPEIELPAEEPVTEEPVIEEPLVIEAEPAAEPVIEEPAAEPVEEKATDALSLEELERDLFGEALDEEVEAEETKKIDKFYTLYRKNEEFQRLLDEEYEKLRHGGGLTEEEKQAVDAVPKMADVEAAVNATAAEPAAPEIPVEEKKVYRQVEDETIYMPKEALEEQLKIDFTNAAAAAAPEKQSPIEVPADKPVELPKAEEKKEDKKSKKAKKAKTEEIEYDDVEHGSKFLTVLAVIIALILIVLLAVILILQIAPDSAAAAWIDSLIESITSGFSMIPPGGGLTLL